jgi:serine phosphatase RsbU (regulator of sigma subunit)/integral membrane sensor domain MASE1
LPAPLGGARDDWAFARWPDQAPGLVLAVVTFVAYAGGSRLAFELAEASGSQAVFFIPAGITLGLLLLAPARRWPAVVVAAGAAELTLDLHAGLSLGATLGFVLANTAEPLIGASITRRWCGGAERGHVERSRSDLARPDLARPDLARPDLARPDLARPDLARPDLARLGHVVAFTTGGVVIGPCVGALVGAAGDTLIGPADFSTTMLQWWLGDALGALIVGAVIVASATRSDRRPTASLTGIGLLVASVALTICLLTVTDLPLLFLVLVGVVAAGAQFGTRMVSITGLAIALTVALDFALDETHTTAGMSSSTGLVLTQLQLGIFTLAGLVVAAEAHERERLVEAAIAHEQAEAARRRLRGVINGLFIGVCISHPDGRLIGANARGSELTSTPSGDSNGLPFWELPAWEHDPAVADLVRTEIVAARHTRRARRFDVHARVGDALVPLDFQIVPLLDDAGQVEQLVMSALDITQRLRDEAQVAASLERQRSITHRLQRSLLPESLPVIDGVELAAVYRSALDEVDVGGDWYDAFTLDDHRLALVIGDVVGRGIDAAGATGQLRSATRAIAAMASGPADVIERLDHFVGGLPAAFAATMLYLELDLRSFELVFCRAGHLPPLLHVPGRPPRFHEAAASPPLATIDGLRRPEGRLQLEPGARLLMCTDGLVERRREPLDVGLSRLAHAVDERWARLGAPLADALAEVADELTDGAEAEDDLCLLAIHRRPGERAC